MLNHASTSRYVQAGDIRLHYNEAGSGPVLLCIHGGAPGAFGWGNLGRNMESLAKHFRVIIVDLPGYGRSDKPAEQTGRHALYVRCMVDMMNALDIDKANILGMATGGAVAIRMAVEHPNLVDKLVLVSSAGGHTTFSKRPKVSASQTYYGGDGPSRQKMYEYLTQLVFDSRSITDSVVTERFEASIEPEFMSKAPEGRSSIRQTPEDLWKRLEEIKAETLIIWGRENQAQPFENAIFMLSQIQRAQLHIFGQCGLWVPYEHMDEFNNLVINFVSRRDDM